MLAKEISTVARQSVKVNKMLQETLMRQFDFQKTMQATQQQYRTMSPIISVPYSIPFTPDEGSFLISPFYPIFSYSTPKPPKPPKYKERKDSSTSSENFETRTETLD